MAIAAVHINSTQFSVVGEHTADIQTGQKVQLLNTGAASTVTTVVGSTFSAQSNSTLVTVAAPVVLSGLYRIKLGLTYAAALGIHAHIDDNSGGLIPASALSESQVTALETVPLPAINANKVLSVNPGATAWEVKTVSGTAHQVIVSMGTGYLEFSMPQDIDTVSSPTFAGLTVSGSVAAGSLAVIGATTMGGAIQMNALTGFVLANGASAATALATTVPGALLRFNKAGTAYEFAVPALYDCSDFSDMELIRFMGI